MFSDKTILLYSEAMKKLFNSIAGRNGIRVKFDPECIQPCATSDKVVTLPYPTAVNADTFWFYSFHELSHLMPGMDWSYKELWSLLNHKDQLTLIVANVILDNLTERSFYGEYAGVDDIMNAGRSTMVKEDTLAQLDKAEEIKKDPVYELLASMCLQDARQRLDWMELSAYPPDEYEFELEKALDTIHYRERLEAMSHVPKPYHQVAELTKDCLKLIDYEPPPPENQDGEGDGEGDTGECQQCSGSGTDGDGNECEACGGTGRKPGDGKDGEEGDGQSDEAESKPGQARPEPPSPIGNPNLKWTHKAGDPKKSQVAEIAKAIDARLLDKPNKNPKYKKRYDVSYYDKETYIPVGKDQVIDCSKDGYPQEGYRELIEKALGQSTVSKQISKYLKALTTESYTYGQRMGKLHNKNIHRVITSKPGVQPTIYKKKDATKIKSDSAVTILLDCSGSMSGSRYAIGSACCVALSETLTALQVKHEVLGFTDRGGMLEHYIFKPYTAIHSRERNLDVMASSKVRMSSNADGESVTWAAERLLTRTEKRKLMIVLSDGQPAGSFGGNGNAYLKKVCTMIENESPIDLVGIGISTTAVEEFYKHNVVVQNPDELDGVLFNVLKDFLTK